MGLGTIPTKYDAPMRTTTALLLLPLAILIASCTSAPVAPTKSPEPIALSFTDSLDRTYDAQLRFPRHRWNRHTALLLGGGAVTDMHWTIPATAPVGGLEIPLTTTGEPTRDADDITAALLDAGFAVFQYSSIHRDDATHAGNPAMADHVSYPHAREIARAALAALRAQPGVDRERIVLVAHSLGGARALQIAAHSPEPIRAMALLAPAYSSRLGGRPSLAAQPTIEALIALDLDPQRGIHRHAWRAKRSALPEAIGDIPFDTLDRDHDEALRRWEIAAAVVLAETDAGDASALTDESLFADETFPADALLETNIPTLLIFGGLDAMTVHAPLIERAADRLGLTNVGVVIAPALGHNLSREVPRNNPELEAIAGPGTVGPIDPRITKLIAEWLGQSVRGDR